MLAVAVHVTVWLPEPLAGEHVNQFGAPLVVLQLQAEPAVTVTVPLLALALGLAPAAESE